MSYATDKGVALLTLTDPPTNAYTHEMLKELDACILEARFDDDVHVIVITGHGDRYFCDGANVHMLKEADETFTHYFCLHAGETLLRLENTPKLVVAAINGHCLGGGFELALACDVRIVRAGPVQIGLSDVDLGLLPFAGGTRRVVRVTGSARALELLAEGQKLSTDEALEEGLVHKVWEEETSDAFVRRVMAYARGFCPPAGPALAVGAIKRAVQAASNSDQGLAVEQELYRRIFATDDAHEGIAAFTQKRRPAFRGR